MRKKCQVKKAKRIKKRKINNTSMIIIGAVTVAIIILMLSIGAKSKGKDDKIQAVGAETFLRTRR